MNYTITDNSTEALFNITVDFENDITSYLENDKFDIELKDIVDTTDYMPTIINGQNILDNIYGLKQYEDPNKKLEYSLIQNGGIVIYRPSSTAICIVLTAKSSDGSNTIGYYSTTVKIKLFDEDDNIETLIDLFANLFPKTIRSETLRQDNSTKEDPILSEPGLRAGYDFNTDTTSAITGMSYNTTDSFYANTIDGMQENEVPLYVSDISAFTINTEDIETSGFEFDWDNAESYIVDENTGSTFDIDFSKDEPFTYTVNTVSGYTAEVNCYQITQYIRKASHGLGKNKLVFRLTNKKE